MTDSRLDRKYLVADEVVTSLLTILSGSLVVEVDGLATQRYETEYLDTPALTLFHEARGQRPERVKVRRRQYVSTGDVFIEVKRRDRAGRIVKDREPWTSAEQEQVFLAGVLTPHRPSLVRELEPMARTSYVRDAYTLDSGGRVTVDRALRVGPHDQCTHELIVEHSRVESSIVVIETKSPDGAPTAVDRALWDLGRRPRPVSKYALAIASFRPDLPLNRWTSAAAHLRPLTVPAS